MDMDKITKRSKKTKIPKKPEKIKKWPQGFPLKKYKKTPNITKKPSTNSKIFPKIQKNSPYVTKLPLRDNLGSFLYFLGDFCFALGPF
jgi:hypothetical protein